MMMFCPQCGAPNEDDAIFCGNCGAVLDADELPAVAESESPEGLASELENEIVEEIPEAALEEIDIGPVPMSDERSVVPPPPPPPRYAPSGAVQTSGLAIASLVSGIAGWTIVPLLGSILAIFLGYAARNEIRRDPDRLTGEGLAVAGLVLGWIMVGITVLGLCLGSVALCFLTGLLGAGG
jgi:uncharacterized Zn finger protein (UPF0148 family)